VTPAESFTHGSSLQRTLDSDRRRKGDVRACNALVARDPRLFAFSAALYNAGFSPNQETP
jgi:hypothetical protein